MLKTLVLFIKRDIIMLAIYGKVGYIMNITDVRVRKIENQNRLRAVASITLDDAFVIHEIRVIEGAKGIFIAMPSRKNKFGVFKDVAHPINTETRSQIEKAVLDEYNKPE